MNFGIMQGRLTPSAGRGIQFFPFDHWREEFDIAKEICLQEIEWIFDFDRYEENPIWTEEGCQKIRQAIELTGVKVNTVCWDYFMRRPFYKLEDERDRISCLNENKEFFLKTLDGMKRIGANLIEIPLVDDSKIETDVEKKEVIEFIQYICGAASKRDVLVGLETDLPPKGKPVSFVEFLKSIERSNIRANFDSGNSSGIGYDAKEELSALGRFVQNVHIKDRKKGNGTMKLGTGSADFDKVFSTLKDIHYQGSFIMQAARGTDGEEASDVCEQVAFVKGYLKKYGFED